MTENVDAHLRLEIAKRIDNECCHLDAKQSFVQVSGFVRGVRHSCTNIGDLWTKVQEYGGDYHLFKEGAVTKQLEMPRRTSVVNKGTFNFAEIVCWFIIVEIIMGDVVPVGQVGYGGR